jgi:quercetin dioxygenase-like cupin family protein
MEADTVITVTPVNLRIGVLLLALVVPASARSPAQSAAPKLPDAITADARHYTVEFENDVVRLLRVRLPAGESAPVHAHAAYCAIEITDSSLREENGPVSESKAGQVFCGDATSHAPRNVGKGLAESIVVEFKNRQRAR